MNQAEFYSYLFAKNCIKMILECSIARRLPSKCTRKMKINERLNIGIRLRVYFLDCIYRKKVFNMFIPLSAVLIITFLF